MDGPTSQRVSSGSTGSRGHSESIRKVAVTAANQQALFLELDQNRPLAGIIQDICDKWNLSSPEDFALQFSEPTRQAYITERNRNTIQNGNVLQLTDSPAQAAQTIIDKLKNGSREEKLESLKGLSLKSTDPTFAVEFINKSGLKLIVDYVMAGNKNFSGDAMMYLLRSFVALMEHNVVNWDILEPDFTKQVAELVSGAQKYGDGCIQPSLEILENIILHSTNSDMLKTIEHYITPDKIIPYIQSNTSVDVKQSALALINAMFIKSDSDQKLALSSCFQSKHFRTIITTNILGNNQNVGSEMAHQLYKLQKLMLNMYEDRMTAKFNASDATQATLVNRHIEDLRRIAFDFTDVTDTNAATNRKSAVSRDYKKLGFLNQGNPMMDFEETPPGLLALDNMIYFAQQHKESYIKVVLENCGRANEQDCPFVQASIKLTKILCDLLKIGEDPFDDEHFYFPMFFCVDNPLEEFFSVCIQLLNRTWKEMRACKEDFPKVLSVVSEQITRALDKSQMPQNYEMFRKTLGCLAYPELKKVWEAERQKKDENKAQAKPILELREMIKPEIMDLIRKQRLLYLEGGTRFPKLAKSARGKYLYWRLTPNHKAFHYDECNENDVPSIDQLPNKVAVLEIKELLKGKNCPHWKAKKTQHELAFTIMLESSQPNEECCHNFIASTEREYNIWVDGIDALLNNKMTSRQTDEDMETLLNMEIKLRLLETEGITIPQDPPPIPPLPDNFNFAYTTA